jgi:hypothetical protein
MNHKHSNKTILIFSLLAFFAINATSVLAVSTVPTTKVDTTSHSTLPATPATGTAVVPTPPVVDTTPPADPFAFGDFTWLNGNDRQHTALLDSKYFTGEFLLDANYTASNQHPIDHTVVGSTALARDNEAEVSLVTMGGDFHYDNVRGRILLQLGTRATVVPRNDVSVTHGQYDLSTAYRYFSEGYGGYHFNVWNGINVDAGIFMSYVGLFSYYNAENWAYQPSFTSDNTPWFFNGMRIQMFPSDKFKAEIWIINGWQSYAKFNNAPGLGCQLLWRPAEWFQLLSNNYEGYDTQDQPDRLRLHTDNSIEIRYFNSQSSSSFIRRAAFSVTQDVGEETGGGVSGFHSGPNGPAQFFVSGMVYHRLWMANDHFGWTFGGGYIHNPGRYLVLAPTGMASPLPVTFTDANGQQEYVANPSFSAAGTEFTGWDCSTTFDWMPNELLTWRLEFVHREASVPYFAGPNGVTSPDGYIGTSLTPGWSVANNLVKAESRVIGAFLVRF